MQLKIIIVTVSMNWCEFLSCSCFYCYKWKPYNRCYVELNDTIFTWYVVWEYRRYFNLLNIPATCFHNRQTHLISFSPKLPHFSGHHNDLLQFAAQKVKITFSFSPHIESLNRNLCLPLKYTTNLSIFHLPLSTRLWYTSLPFYSFDATVAF